MQLVFIDDSGQSDPRREHLGELVSVGAVIFPEHQVSEYTKEIDLLRAEIGMPDDQEFKWNSPRGSFLAKAGGPTVKEQRRKMLEIAARCEVRTAVVIWDRSKVTWDKHEAAGEILKYLYERIERHLRTYDERGVVIADVPGGGAADHSKWLAQALDLTTAGTRYAKPERVIMPIVTAPSHHVPHLQLADLVTAATTAAFAGHTSGLELMDMLKPLARTNAYGDIGGTGVVLWPPDLNDLYFWVLGQKSWWKGSNECRLGPSDGPFAQPGRPFQNSDGMPE
ncbi:hypothetical protein GCM10012287_26750 [Streptomyces daqingensis]|uniref:DUF3800 domain-containing protein n=1 Tax=Streptomyces daqingensis TaxID=1472640 RepID=A0ABQ2MBS5_9ACTN|nr:DUF3800 domain-containing protein [Streptomyces daqingensis]GGO49426.1 hypothetical protein GCM10012287_26750 [Streptomyces daqingensis]